MNLIEQIIWVWKFPVCYRWAFWVYVCINLDTESVFKTFPNLMRDNENKTSSEKQLHHFMTEMLFGQFTKFIVKNHYCNIEIVRLKECQKWSCWKTWE